MTEVSIKDLLAMRVTAAVGDSRSPHNVAVLMALEVQEDEDGGFYLRSRVAPVFNNLRFDTLVEAEQAMEVCRAMVVR